MEAQTVPASWSGTIERYRNWLIASGKSARTVELRLYQVSRFANAMTVALDRIGPEDVMLYLARPEWGAHTRNVVRSSISSYFQWATEYGVVSVDPTVPLKPTRVPARVLNPPSRKEIAAAIAGTDKRTGLMIRLAADAGLKAMEIARCHTRDLQQTDDGDYALRAVSQNSRVRILDVPPKLAEDILAMPAGFLFPGRMDGHISPAYVSRLVSRAFESEVTAEDVRAAAGSRSARAWRETPGYHSPDALRLLDDADLAQSRVVQQQLRRIARDIDRDPAAAISECKNLLEGLFKLILTDRDVDFRTAERMPILFRLVSETLSLGTESVPGSDHGSGGVEGTLRGLVDTVTGIATTRNAVGTGHGQHTVSAAEPRHAYLAFNATVAVAEFLAESWHPRA